MRRGKHIVVNKYFYKNGRWLLCLLKSDLKWFNISVEIRTIQFACHAVSTANDAGPLVKLMTDAIWLLRHVLTLNASDDLFAGIALRNKSISPRRSLMVLSDASNLLSFSHAMSFNNLVTSTWSNVIKWNFCNSFAMKAGTNSGLDFYNFH